MPSPKRRAKALRGPLSESEIRELLSGHAASCFPTPDAFLAAQRRLAIEMEEWDPLDWWRYGLRPDGEPLSGPTLEGEPLRDFIRRFLDAYFDGGSLAACAVLEAHEAGQRGGIPEEPA
jgi:hypothetical protein